MWLRIGIGLWAWIFLAGWGTGCRQRSANPGASDSFAEFYAQFHADSVYQMEHIPFPIGGMPSFTNSDLAQTPDFQWTLENWRLHRPLESKEFTQEFTQLGDGLIEEQILHQSGRFGMLRRFARMGDGEWYLIYFADLNPVRPNTGGAQGEEER